MSPDPSHSDDPRAELARDRTSMANFRTQLALDRTTLAWVRTALAMTSFGFGMVAFFRTMQRENPDAETIRLHQHATRMGTALLVMGIISTLLAGGSHWLSLRRLRQGKLPALRRWPVSITLALVFAIVGLIGLWALFVH
jgi:putative membrane protein